MPFFFTDINELVILFVTSRLSTTIVLSSLPWPSQRHILRHHHHHHKNTVPSSPPSASSLLFMHYLHQQQRHCHHHHNHHHQHHNHHHDYHHYHYRHHHQASLFTWHATHASGGDFLLNCSVRPSLPLTRDMKFIRCDAGLPGTVHGAPYESRMLQPFVASCCAGVFCWHGDVRFREIIHLANCVLGYFVYFFPEPLVQLSLQNDCYSKLFYSVCLTGTGVFESKERLIALPLFDVSHKGSSQ